MIGILYIGIGTYAMFWKDFYLSAEKHLFAGTDAAHPLERRYFVWTDAAQIFNEENDPRIIRIAQDDLGWPGNSLKRYHLFLGQRERLESLDYLIFFNANLRFLADVSAQALLPDTAQGEHLLAALHATFYHQPPHTYTYERNPLSTACIPAGSGEYYAQGALMGGQALAFLSACATMARNIEIDEAKGIIALWHDESHWNRFLYQRRDVKILSPSYLYPENAHLDFPAKILSLDKSRFFDVHAFKGLPKPSWRARLKAKVKKWLLRS